MLCNSFASKKLTFSPELSEILLNIIEGDFAPMSLDALIGRRIDSTDLIRIMQTNAADQISYYSQLKKIPNLDSNVPENISTEGDDILIKISPDSPQSLISSITKIIALLNKFRAVPLKKLQDQRLPDTIALYEKAFDVIVKENEKVALPYKSWNVNGTRYTDLFNTSLYYKAIDIIYHLMGSFTPGIVHGNFYFENVIRSKNNLIIINPRSSFGNGPSILGDPRCDLSKIRVSTRGVLNCIDKGAFLVYRCEGDSIDYDILGAYDRDIPLQLVNKYAESVGIDPLELDLFEGSIYLLSMGLFKESLKKRLIYMEALKLLIPALEKFSSVF